MQCDYFQSKLDEAIDGSLAEYETRTLRLHMQQCAHCLGAYRARQHLLERLSHWPTPPMDAQLAQRILHGIQRRRSRYIQGFAVAASVLFFVAALTLVQFQSFSTSQMPLAQTPTPVNVPQQVNFLVQAGKNLEDVQFMVQLPQDVELAGFPGKSQLVWQGRLKKGDNLLTLPVITKTSPIATPQGEIVMRVEHQTRIKILKVRLNERAV